MDMQMFTEILTIILLSIVTAIYVGWQIKKKGLKPFVIDLILRAETLYKKGQNDEKMSFVISAIKETIGKTIAGKILMNFITDGMVQNFIQGVFDGLKKALDYNPNKESE